MPVTLDLEARNIDEVLELYDRLRVERASSASGPFTEVTHASDDALAATLLGSQVSPFTLNGLTLGLAVDGAPAVTISFVGTDPMSIAQAVSQINTALGASVASNENGQLRLRSTITGSGSSLTVTAGTALAALGLTLNQADIGREPWISLNAHNRLYQIEDAQGSVAATYYRTYYFSSRTNQQSSYSAVFLGSSSQVLTGTSLSLATVDLVDLQGNAVRGVKVYIVPVRNYYVPVAGLVVDSGKRITLETDGAGHAEVSLVRGATVKVIMGGTGDVREIVVPDQTTFDLMAAVASVPDKWSVVFPNLPAAPARSV